MADSTPSAPKTYSFPYLAAAALVGLILGVLIAWAFVVSRDGGAPAADDVSIPNVDLRDISQNAASSTPAPPSKSSDMASGSESLSVADQPAGMLVTVARAAVTEGQWVVVHESRDGNLGNVLGAARFVGGATAGAVELLRATQAGFTYYAVIYADNGDRQFSLDLDTPLTDATGTPKSVSFKAQ